MSVDVVTFGCRLNAYESEVIRRKAEAAGVADTVRPTRPRRTAATAAAQAAEPQALVRPAPRSHCLLYTSPSPRD